MPQLDCNNSNHNNTNNNNNNNNNSNNRAQEERRGRSESTAAFIAGNSKVAVDAAGSNDDLSASMKKSSSMWRNRMMQHASIGSSPRGSLAGGAFDSTSGGSTPKGSVASMRHSLADDKRAPSSPKNTMKKDASLPRHSEMAAGDLNLHALALRNQSERRGHRSSPLASTSAGSPAATLSLATAHTRSSLKQQQHHTKRRETQKSSFSGMSVMDAGSDDDRFASRLASNAFETPSSEYELGACVCVYVNLSFSLCESVSLSFCGVYVCVCLCVVTTIVLPVGWRRMPLRHQAASMN
jgi:hypothetical protein